MRQAQLNLALHAACLKNTLRPFVVLDSSYTEEEVDLAIEYLVDGFSDTDRYDFGRAFISRSVGGPAFPVAYHLRKHLEEDEE